MKKNIRTAAGLTLLGMLGAFVNCSAYVAQFDYDRNEDFSAYTTYDFYPLPQAVSAEADSRVIQRVKEALTRELKAKGFSRSTEDPDLLIAIHTQTKEKINITNWGYTYAPYDYYWRGDDYWHGEGIDEYQYEEGSLMLDMVRADEDEMIWRGLYSRALPLKLTPEKIDKLVDHAVATILESFPPQQK